MQMRMLVNAQVHELLQFDEEKIEKKTTELSQKSWFSIRPTKNLMIATASKMMDAEISY